MVTIDNVITKVSEDLNIDREQVDLVCKSVFQNTKNIMQTDNTKDILFNELFKFKLKNKFKPMKKIYYTNRSNCTYFGEAILCENVVGDIDTLPNESHGIDTIRVAPDDVEIVYKTNGAEKRITAEKGDLIIAFYDQKHIKNRIVTVKSKEWLENIQSWHDTHDKQIADVEVEAYKSDAVC